MGAKENMVQRSVLHLLSWIPGAVIERRNVRVIMMPGKGGRPRPVKFGSSGEPDVQALLPAKESTREAEIGRALFIGVECKAGRGKATPEQLAYGRRLEAAGGVYVVAYHAWQVEAVLRQWGYLSSMSSDPDAEKLLTSR